MTKRTIIGFAIVAALALGGCGGSSSDSSSDGGSKAGSGDTTNAGDTTAPTGTGDEAGGCDGYTAGEDDVIRTFCDGTASLKVTIGENEYTMDGGECESSGGYFAVNIGVVTGQSFTGTKPDYFGSNMPEADGDFGEGDNAFATFALEGESISAPGIQGSHDSNGGSFTGTTIDGQPVVGTFTC